MSYDDRFTHEQLMELRDYLCGDHIGHRSWDAYLAIKQLMDEESVFDKIVDALKNQRDNERKRADSGATERQRLRVELAAAEEVLNRFGFRKKFNGGQVTWVGKPLDKFNALKSQLVEANNTIAQMMEDLGEATDSLVRLQEDEG